MGDGLNYLAGYDELEVTEGGEDAHTGEHTEDDAVDDRKAMWGQLKDMLEVHIMSMFSLPTFLMEPVSTLQKMAEIMQYQRLLEEGERRGGSRRKTARAATGALSAAVFHHGESEEALQPHLGRDIRAEDERRFDVRSRVSHHPPIGAGHVKTKSFWPYDITSATTTKFMGNWVDVFPVGRTRITLHKTGETFNIVPPSSRVNNLIIGRIWIDTFGEMKVLNLTTGAIAELDFKAMAS